jgi:hypothetical protein
MAVTATPIFVQSPAYGCAQISTANTNRDGSGTIGTVLTAGANGTLVDHIDVCATGTTTAGMVRIYIHDGSNARLWREITVAAITPSTTVNAFSYRIECGLAESALYLPVSHSLRASTHNAETFNVFAFGGNL